MSVGGGLLTLLSLSGLSQALPQLCGADYELWPADQKCYRLRTQGPCGEDQVFLQSFRGAQCVSFETEDPVTPPSTSTTSTTSIPTIQCGGDEALWPADNQCYRLKTQGPCGNDEVFLKRHGLAICSGFDEDSRSQSRKKIPSSREEKWRLPTSRAMTSNEAACLTEGKVYWPRDRECYSLLERGPCQAEEWLVVRGEDISCQPRPCPCHPDAPELCEVELRNVTGSSCQRCVVARAAAQDGLCQPGEELLVNPAGYGECGCQTEPPHLRWPGDDQCYPLTTRGPCRPGFSLQLGRDSQPACEASRCGEGEVEYQGGGGGGEGTQCHVLGLRGPCMELEILSLHPDTLQPRCEPDIKVSRSPWYAIPRFRRGRVRVGALPTSRKQTNCRVNRYGRCQPIYRHPNSVTPVKRDPADYLKMLRYFRGR